MSNDVKVDFDPDPNENHQKLLEAFFDYINVYEQFRKFPSHYTRKESRLKLLAVHKIAKDMRADINNVHLEVLKLRRAVYDENERQRQIKKATKGK